MIVESRLPRLRERVRSVFGTRLPFYKGAVVTSRDVHTPGLGSRATSGPSLLSAIFVVVVVVVVFVVFVSQP